MSNPPHHRLRILFADDEVHLQELMRMELPRLGHEVTVCPDGRTALAALELNSYDAAILDLDMPEATGLEVLARLRDIAPDTDAVILTGKGSMDSAIEALRHGAFDWVTKPCKLAELDAILNRIAEKRALTHKALALESRLRAAEGSVELVGSSLAMRDVKELIETVAPTNSTVLILGETGTGKELVARQLHEQSPRAAMPFVPVNCAALPENLVESELFGHRKGAYTGADQNRKGLFEVASGGTLFLDEMGELPPAIQVKLLRFLESGEIRRVGENDPFVVDVRVLCATNRDLVEMVEEGSFREDLFFRINTFEIRLPPLRERKDDIPELARHLLARYLKRKNVPPDLLSDEVIAALKAHDWPGNVRELANVLEHAVIVSRGGPITPEHLPRSFGSRGVRSGTGVSPPARRLAGPHYTIAGPKTLREIELEIVQHVLEKHAGNKPKAAEELGVSLKTLYNKLKELHETSTAA